MSEIEMCVSIKGFKTALNVYDANTDSVVCDKDVPKEKRAEFKRFISANRIDPLMIVEGKEILKSQLDLLQGLLSANKLDLMAAPAAWAGRLIVEKGYIVGLDLSLSAVKDIRPLKKFTNLVKLNLVACGVTDISALKGLKQLEELGLSSNVIVDIKPLQGLVNLKKLFLKNTAVNDISALKGLVNLEELELSNTLVGNIDGLKDMSKLRRLGLSFTLVSDFNALKGMKNLEVLYLNLGGDFDVSILKELPSLKEVYLIQSQIAQEKLNELKKDRPDLKIVTQQNEEK